MSDGLGDVVILAVGFGKFLVSLALLIFILVLLAEDQELSQVFDRRGHVSLLLANETDLLVALGFLVDIVGLLRHVDTLLVEL